MSSSTGKASSSSRRPMTRKYRKTLQEKEELETAAPENKQLISLLDLPLDVTELLLEYVASEPRAVLNLRRVCSTTKRWIDSLRPSQANRIFSRLPITLNFTWMGLENFERIPPPPSASVLKFSTVGAISILKEEFRLKKLQKPFPTFCAFWRHKMFRLFVDNYSLELLNALGIPKALRNLICTNEIVETETHPTLLQLESITCDYESQPSLKFFRHIARSRSLKRLSLSVCSFSLDNREYPYDSKRFEGAQIVLDSKRSPNNADFHIDFHFAGCDYGSYFPIANCEVESFLASIAASTASIRMFRVPNILAEQILRIRAIDDDNGGGVKKFMDSIESMYHIGIAGQLENSCVFSQRQLLRNMKTLCLHIQEENRNGNARSEISIMDLSGLPEGIQNVHLVSCTPVIQRRLVNFPKTLVALMVEQNFEDGATANDWVELLTRVSQRCPDLEELTIKSKINVEWFSVETRRGHSYAFKKLRSLKFEGEIVGATEQKSASQRRLIDTLLFDILQIDQMSLLEFTLNANDGKLRIDLGCVKRLLRSPCAKSLVSLSLGCKVNRTVVEHFIYDKLRSIIKDNKVKYRKRHGRLQSSDTIHPNYFRG